MDVKLPKLGEGADSGVVVTIFVKEGDTIAKDQAIIELENEKAVASIPAATAGVVEKVFGKPGDKLSVGQRILSLKGGTPSGGAPDEPVPLPSVPTTTSAPRPFPGSSSTTSPGCRVRG